MKIKYLLLLVVAVFATSCALKTNLKDSSSNEELLNSDWQIVQILDSSIKEKVNGKTPYLSFDKEAKRYSVSTGCNGLSGDFILDKASISLKAGISTMMFCNDMSVEDGFKSIMPLVSSYAMVGDMLYLKDGNKTLVKLKKNGTQALANLVGTSWELDMLAVPGVNFNEMFAGKKPTISFLEESRISGNASCNNYGASYTMEGSSISFGAIGSTKMMCPNIKAEDLYLSTLSKVNKYSYSENVLTLIIGDIAVMRFKKI